MKKLLSLLLIAWLVLNAGVFCHAAEDEAGAAAEPLRSKLPTVSVAPLAEGTALLKRYGRTLNQLLAAVMYSSLRSSRRNHVTPS